MRNLIGLIASLKDSTKTRKYSFQFNETGVLLDGDLQLILRKTYPGNRLDTTVPEYIFEMVSTNHIGSIMGKISLRIAQTEQIRKYAGHIGYSVDPNYRGNRLAARSCLLILPLALSHGINPVWITCNPENHASRRTCKIIGAKLIETIPIPSNNPLYNWDTKWKCRYRLDL